ncbi:MAG: hypothetical protein NTX04_07755 [Verrucomicrobia bacterium]|nr:hypothetical protein [Verrucomicrobiota bacterium]
MPTEHALEMSGHLSQQRTKRMPQYPRRKHIRWIADDLYGEWLARHCRHWEQQRTESRGGSDDDRIGTITGSDSAPTYREYSWK